MVQRPKSVDCAHMYEKLVNQNLNYVYTRTQSPTGMKFAYMDYIYPYELNECRLFQAVR